MEDGLKAVVDRIEGDFLVLKVAGDQELFWPLKMSAKAKEGEVFELLLKKDGGAEANDEGSAKELLRQIFKSDV